MLRTTKHDVTDDETEIIRAVAAGDRAAYGHIVARYKSRIFCMLLRQLGSRSAAEELAQEIFVKAYLHIKDFRFESGFSTWLTRIAINHLNSYFNSRRFKQQCRTEEFLPELHGGRAESPESLLQKREAAARFQQALLRLSPKLRVTIMLCGLEGKSYEEAAEIMNVPVGTVRSRLNKARLKLRKSCAAIEEGGRRA